MPSCTKPGQWRRHAIVLTAICLHMLIIPTISGHTAEAQGTMRKDASFFSYDPSRPMNPRSSLEADLPEYQRYHVTYEVEGETVHSTYFKPRIPGKVPAVVGIHGIYSSDKAQFWPIAQEIARRGIAVLMPSLPYHHERRTKGSIISGQGIIVTDSAKTIANFRRAVVETRRGLDWLSECPEVDPSRIGAMGVSLGALVTSLALKAEPRFRSGAIVVGGCDLQDVVWTSGTFMAGLIRSWDRMGLADFEHMGDKWEAIDPSLYPDTNDNRPVLMLNGTRDIIFSPYQVNTLARSWKDVRQDWTDSGHYYPELLACYQTAYWFRNTLNANSRLDMDGMSYIENPSPMNPGDSHLEITLEFGYGPHTYEGHKIALPLVDRKAPVIIGTREAHSRFPSESYPFVRYTLPNMDAGNLSLACRYLQRFSGADPSNTYVLWPHGDSLDIRRIGFADAAALATANPSDKGNPLDLKDAPCLTQRELSRYGEAWLRKNGFSIRHYSAEPPLIRWSKPNQISDLKLTVRSVMEYIGKEFFNIRMHLYYNQ